ncbi:MAG: zinc ribbon domain-containing protein [Candidatus Omnitrophota bacterium]|nr:zinc ribbon domain-containing protein [Candidatus Omnitrophota bacterium]
MPIYEYECKKCALKFEYLVRSSNDEVICPKCKGSKLQRLISSFSFQSKDAGGNITNGSSSCSSCASHNCSNCSG